MAVVFTDAEASLIYNMTNGGRYAVEIVNELHERFGRKISRKTLTDKITKSLKTDKPLAYHGWGKDMQRRAAAEQSFARRGAGKKVVSARGKDAFIPDAPSSTAIAAGKPFIETTNFECSWVLNDPADGAICCAKPRARISGCPIISYCSEHLIKSLTTDGIKKYLGQNRWV